MERSLGSEMVVVGDQVVVQVVQVVQLPPCGRSYCSDWENGNFVLFGNSNGLFVCEKTTGATSFGFEGRSVLFGILDLDSVCHKTEF